MWVHVAFTYDGSKNKMFLNGTLSSSTSTNSIGISSIKTSNYIGRYVHISKSCPYCLGDFVLDELKFFNRPLPQAEIINDMNLNN